MKMNLKNRKKIDINIFTKKNYLIFLISFFIVSIIVGIIFFLYLNTNDKNLVIENINNHFTIPNNYDYLTMLLDSLKNNLFNTIIIWILGISIIGSVYNLNLYFFEGFSLGFTIMGILNIYKFKGILGTILYLFPSKLIYIILMFILTYFSIKFSYNMTEHLFLKKEISLQDKMKNYLKILIICLIISIICSLLEVFVDPFMIKAFTFLMK